MSGDGGARLTSLLADAGLPGLDPDLSKRFCDYLALLVRWNQRINLTSIRNEEDILKRHFFESIVCARSVPAGISTLLDYGSGAGIPGIPIALCRAEIAVTLAESNGKKAAFLREAVRVLGIGTKVHAGRAEELGVRFDCVALRAVDRMGEAIGRAGELVMDGGWLVAMTTGAELKTVQSAAGSGFTWRRVEHLMGSGDRLIALGQRGGVPA